jgi:hypothetical protein
VYGAVLYLQQWVEHQLHFGRGESLVSKRVYQYTNRAQNPIQKLRAKCKWETGQVPPTIDPSVLLCPLLPVVRSHDIPPQLLQMSDYHPLHLAHVRVLPDLRETAQEHHQHPQHLDPVIWLLQLRQKPETAVERLHHQPAKIRWVLVRRVEGLQCVQ